MNQENTDAGATSDPEPQKAPKRDRRAARQSSKEQNQQLNEYFCAGRSQPRRGRIPDNRTVRTREGNFIKDYAKPSREDHDIPTDSLSWPASADGSRRHQPQEAMATHSVQQTQRMTPKQPLMPLRFTDTQLPPDKPRVRYKEVVTPDGSRGNACPIQGLPTESKHERRRESSRAGYEQCSTNGPAQTERNNAIHTAAHPSIKPSMDRPVHSMRDSYPAQSTHQDQSPSLHFVLRNCAASLYELERSKHTPHVVA